MSDWSERVAEAFPEALAVANEEGRLVWMNARFAAWSGSALGSPAPDGPLEGHEVEDTRLPLGRGAWLLRWRQKGVVSPVEQQVKFLTLVSHDVRGMLANVRSYASLLLMGKTPLEEKPKRSVEVIARNADRAIATLQDYFDLSRAELGQVATDVARRPLRTLVNEGVEATRKAAADAQVAVETEAEDVQVTVDGDRVLHALRAFLLHGIGRAGAGGRLLVRAKRESGGRLSVVVEDSGPSLSTEAAAQAFDVRGRALIDHKLGTGFAMGVAATLLGLMGGQVWVGPSGTTFGFSLPA